LKFALADNSHNSEFEYADK